MKAIEFTAPKGLSVPEGKGGGQNFDMLATFRAKSNGRMCLVAIGDYKMPGYDQAEPQPDLTKEVGMNAANRYREKMSGMEGGAY